MKLCLLTWTRDVVDTLLGTDILLPQRSQELCWAGSCPASAVLGDSLWLFLSLFRFSVSMGLLDEIVRGQGALLVILSSLSRFH